MKNLVDQKKKESQEKNRICVANVTKPVVFVTRWRGIFRDRTETAGCSVLSIQFTLVQWLERTDMQIQDGRANMKRL